MRSLFLLLFLASLVHCEEIKVKLVHQWPNGFKMEMNHNMMQSVEGGWKMTLKFSKPIARIQFPQAHQISATPDKRVFCLKNWPYSENLEAGSKLVMDFVGEKAVQNEAAPSATLELHPGKDAKCDMTPPPTVIPPGATPPVQETSTAELVNEWPTGFKMKISIVMQQKVEGGWEMTLTFPTPVKNLKAPRARRKWRSPDRKVYKLENRPHNSFIEKCSTLEMVILGKKQKNSAAPSEAAIEFRRKENWAGEGEVGGCVPSTTRPPMTTGRPITTKPPPTTGKPTTTEPPITTEKSTEPPITTDEPTEPPITTDEPTEPPISTDEPTEPPVSTDEPTEPPISTDEPTEPPVSTDKPTEPPISTDEPTEPPISTDEPTEPPISTNQPTEPPVSTDEPTEPPVSTDEPTEPPVSTDEPTEPPVTTEAPPEPTTEDCTDEP